MVVSFEDGSFKTKKSKGCLLVGVLCDDFRIVDIAFRIIEVDGFDVTDKVIDVISSFMSRGLKINYIITGGVTFAGFNILDIFRVYSKFKIPVIIFCGKQPSKPAVFRALVRHFKDWVRRVSLVSELPPPLLIETFKGDSFWVEVLGVKVDEVIDVLSYLTIWGKPEPLRIADIVAKQLSKCLMLYEG